MNCEDIAMNFLIANYSGLPPLKVRREGRRVGGREGGREGGNEGERKGR